MKIALVQFESILNQYEENLKKAINYINKAAAGGANLVCLPEAFPTTLDLANIDSIAESLDGNTVNTLQQEAKKSNIYVCAGFIEKFEDKNYSTAVIINNQGEIMGAYRRIHIFQLENGFVSNGSQPLVLDLPFAKIGVILGYDIYFPELCRSYFKENVELIICPGVIPSMHSYTTRQIIKARAIENNCYFAFISHVGFNLFANFAYMGNSMVTINPTFYEDVNPDYEDGEEILVQGTEDEEQLLFANLDIKSLRRQIVHNPQLLDIQLI